MVHFINKMHAKKKYISPISIIVNTDRYIWYVCVGLQLHSSNCHFIYYLANMVIMATTYLWLILWGEKRKKSLPLPFLQY